MNLRTSKTPRVSQVVVALGITGILLTATGEALIADSNNSALAAPVGTWAVQVTLRDCATNAPLGPPFNSLVTFHRGGTISESAASLAFAPGQRTPGHGIWSREGRRSVGQRMISLILFDTPANLPGPGFNPNLPVSPGFFAGWVTVTHTVKQTDPDHFTSAGGNEFFKSDGTRYRTGCSTAVGQRFE